MSYIEILEIFLAVTILLEVIFKPHLFDSAKERIIAVLLLFVVGVMWDSYAVYSHHWTFSGIGLLGVYVGNLPLEEYIFSLIIPYFCITVAKIIQEKIK